ncbi:MAG: sensor histidine kinase [Aquisalimonadaceae bacterium]
MLLILLLPAGIGLMALAWFIHGALLERMSRDFVESRLKDEAAYLEHQIRQSEGRIDTLRTGDYFQEVFHHAFAIASPYRQTVSPQSWAPLLMPLLASEREGTVRVRDASSVDAPSDILAHRRSFLVNDSAIVVIVAEDMEALQSSQAELHAWTAVVSLLLIVLLVGSIWLAITLSMRPVVSLQATLRKLQSGEISRINVEGPEEFRPLVQQLNHLLDSLDQRLERSRDALANLSHSVKTPIAAVRQILEDTSRPLDGDLRREMASRLADTDKQLEAEMRRSRFAGPQVGKSAYPVKQARDLLWMLGRLYPEKSFELSTDLTQERRWPIEEHDLNEILGNLLDNAGKWSSRCVELSLAESREQMQIVVSDDGPGVADEAREELGKRGLRLDEQTPGHGLGLAIVLDIVHRYEGRINFAISHMGGLRAAISLPRPK